MTGRSPSSCRDFSPAKIAARTFSRRCLWLILSAVILLPLRSEAAFERVTPFNLIPISPDRCGFIRLSFDHPFGIKEIGEHLLEGELRRNEWALGGRIRNFGISDGEVRYAEWSASIGLGTRIDRFGFGVWMSGYRLEVGDDRRSGIGMGSSISLKTGWIEISAGGEVPIRRIERTEQRRIAFLILSGDLIHGVSVSASLERGIGYLRFPIGIKADLTRSLTLHLKLEPSLWSVSTGFDVGYGPISLNYIWDTHPSLPDTHRFGLTIRALTGSVSRSPPSDS